MKKLALIHTTPVTIDLLKALAAELMPGVGLINLMDDSILPQLLANGGDLSAVKERWLGYVRAAEQAGADVIMSACSSVGDLVTSAAALAHVPVLRIDSAMAEEAVRRASVIGVAATLPTTLNPTLRLIQAQAEHFGKTIQTRTALATSAYQRLMAGDKEGHDAELLAALQTLSREVEVIVLAQASMARVLPALSPEEQARFLTSPRSGMLRARQVLEGQHD